MSSGRTAAKEAKLRAILDAATELLVEKPTASLNDIAEYAGIGIATLHRYIESREQLMLQLGLRAVEVVEETLRRIRPVGEIGDDYIRGADRSAYSAWRQDQLPRQRNIASLQRRDGRCRSKGEGADPGSDPIAPERGRIPRGYERGLDFGSAVFAAVRYLAAGSRGAHRQQIGGEAGYRHVVSRCGGRRGSRLTISNRRGCGAR